MNRITLDEVDDLVGYWKDAPPVHMTLMNLVKSFGGKATSSHAPTSSGQPTGTPNDWASSRTTAPKPTQAELRGVVDQLHR